MLQRVSVEPGAGDQAGAVARGRRLHQTAESSVPVVVGDEIAMRDLYLLSAREGDDPVAFGSLVLPVVGAVTVKEPTLTRIPSSLSSWFQAPARLRAFQRSH